MKKLAIALGLASMCSFAQDRSLSLELSKDGFYDIGHWFNTIHEPSDAHLEPGKGEFKVLPTMINITSFVRDNGLDLENITAEDLHIAVLGFGTADLDDPENLAVKEKNKLFMTMEGNFLSFEKRTIFFKGDKAQYAAWHFADLKLGAAVKLGDEFYVQLEAYGSAPGVQLGKVSNEHFSITEAEFEEFKELVGCGNCSRDNKDPYFNEGVDATFKYGGELKVKYKRFGLSLYNNNYYGLSHQGLVYNQPGSGEEETPYTTKMRRRRTVREFGVELTGKIADIGERGSLSAMIGYAMSVHHTRVIQRDSYYRSGEPRPYLTEKRDVQLESTPELENLGRLNFGLKLKF